MCGIAGFVGMNNDALLRGMCASLEHRGPDDEGFYTADGVGLAMRRLAVVDLTTGRQPISNEAGDVWVVFNGEIYNYEELRSDLESGGHRFATRTDTETIVHLYEEHGIDCLSRLRGMFALALWDVPRRRLLLARDRIGEKPLYYSLQNGRLLFGSEIKAILQSRMRPAVDLQSIASFLALGYIPGSRSAFSGIAKLAPAHCLVFEDSTITVSRYWARRPPATPTTEAAAADELRETLDQTVKLCLKSDVEVGAFLSGGLDSSLLVALMRRHAARVKTFTVGYEGVAAGFNELDYARRVARDLDADHHELILRPEASLDLLPRVLSHYDEPHGEPTSMLVYQLCQFARRRVKVSIGGTGSDEIFFGYPRHRAIRWLSYYRQLPRPLRRLVVDRVVARWPESTTGSRFAKRARRFVGGGDASPAQAYLAWVRLLDRDVHRALLTDRVRDGAVDADGDSFLRDHLLASGDRSLLDRAAAVDVGGYLPEYQLAYMDRMSMAHGLEVRSPFCDYRLVEFVTGLPPHYRLKAGRSKHLLKEIATEWLPAAIVNRSKVGFDSPIGQWFKDELRPLLTAFLAPREVARTGLLNPDTVQRLLNDHLCGRRDYSLQLWSVLAVEAWARMYFDHGMPDPDQCLLGHLRGAESRAALQGQTL